MLPAAASVMTQAISLAVRREDGLEGLDVVVGQTRVSAAISVGTPALSGRASVATPEPALTRRESTWPW